jgi:hypothetical protein
MKAKGKPDSTTMTILVPLIMGMASTKNARAISESPRFHLHEPGINRFDVQDMYVWQRDMDIRVQSIG